MINLKKAIEHYNKNVRSKEQPRLTQKSLGLIVMPDKSAINSENYMHRVIKGSTSLDDDLVKPICEVCKVDANFLYSTKKMK